MIRKYIKYIVIFVISFYLVSVIQTVNLFNDLNFFYLFSHKLINGGIPYIDFNIITTPLYIFYISLGLLIIDNINIVLLEHSLLITLSFILLNKLYGDKAYLLFLYTLLVAASNILPSYNFLTLFIIIIIIYLEKKYNNKDLLIGIFIGLAILSKHTVGIFLIIPTLIFYKKDKKKVLKRLIGLLIPNLIFLLYLLFTKSLYSFIDLCILGLFDFFNSNGIKTGNIDYFYFSLSIIGLIISILIIIKDKKEITNYYLIYGIILVFPLFDFNHTALYFNFIIIMLLKYINYNQKHIKIISIISSILILLFLSLQFYKSDFILYKDKYFRNKLIKENKYSKINKMSKYLKKYKNPIILSTDAVYYCIINNYDNGYFSIPLNGNYGYDGINKMKKRIDKLHNQVFIVSMEEYNNKQFSKEIAQYIIDNYEKIDSKYEFEVYYKK